MLQSAEERGIAIGRELVRKMGSKEGIDLVAANLITRGMDDEQIIGITGLDPDTVKKVRKSHGSG